MANIYKVVAGYGLVTEAKVRRAEKAANGDEELTLSLYASYGGLILDEKGNEVACDEFFDFGTKKPILKAKKVTKKEKKKEVKKVTKKDDKKA